MLLIVFTRTVQDCKKQKTSGETLFLQLTSMNPTAKEDHYHSENRWDMYGVQDDIHTIKNRVGH